LLSDRDRQAFGRRLQGQRLRVLEEGGDIAKTDKGGYVSVKAVGKRCWDGVCGCNGVLLDVTELSNKRTAPDAG